MTGHEALRDDFEHAVRRVLNDPMTALLPHEAATHLANELVHLVVLHGLLPEAPRATHSVSERPPAPTHAEP